MVKQLVEAYRLLFPSRRYAWLIAGLILFTALVPVSEMMVARIFSNIIVGGKELYETDPAALFKHILVFFGAFAVTRTIHHLLRALRVMTVRKALSANPRQRSKSDESWEWALAFELTGIISVIVQMIVFSAYFVFVSSKVGMVNIVVATSCVIAVSLLYRRQLAKQRAYLAKPKAEKKKEKEVPIGAKVQSRVIDAELGSVIASVGLVLMFGVLLWEVIVGDIVAADAIVLFLATRLLYGQIGNMSAHLMRFARAGARILP
jgi:hypothetical protein